MNYEVTHHHVTCSFTSIYSCEYLKHFKFRLLTTAVFCLWMVDNWKPWDVRWVAWYHTIP